MSHLGKSGTKRTRATKPADRATAIEPTSDTNTQARATQKDPAHRVPGIVPGWTEDAVDVDTLHDHPDNPNKGNVQAIAESLHENDQFGAIYAQVSTRRILAGHHTLLAAKAQGMKHVRVLWHDVDDAKALRILLAHNATAELAKRDADRVAAAVAKLPGDPLAGTGYRFHPLAATLPAMVASLRIDTVAPAELASTDGDPPADDDEADDATGDDEGTGQGDDDPDDPDPGWDGTMEAEPEDDAGDGDEAPESKPKPWESQTRPLAIVLDKHEGRRWDNLKGRLSAARDKVAFMLCVDAMIELMDKAEGKEEVEQA